MNPPLSSPKAIAELGEKIYNERYKAQYEHDHQGRFVAIDVTTGASFIGDTPESVLEAAKEASPQGLFHLIQVGFSGAFRVSFTNHAFVDWIFR